ncbi:MAG: hypothetical protein AABZ08_11075 [Planctomycetota bacterium]
MAEQPKSSAGKSTALFLLFFLPIAGGLAATPYYLGMVSTPDRQLDAAIANDVEAVHRAVLHLDGQLASLKQMRDPEDKPSDELFEKKDVLKEYLPALSGTSKLLGDAEARMKQLGLKGNPALKITSGAPSLKGGYADMMRLASAQDKMLSETEAAISKVNSIERGGKRASSHLWVDRAVAILQFSKARIHQNRGEFEEWRAGLIRTAAEAQAPILLQMKRLAAAVESQRPTTALAAVAKRLEESEASAADAESASKKLASEISKKESQSNQLDATAQQARGKIAELLASKQSPVAYEKEVQGLSSQARTAEAESAALLNGTLEGATVKPSDSVDPTVPTYLGGKPVRGIRDMKSEQETLGGQLQLLTSQKRDLLAEQETLTKSNEQFETQKAEIDKGIESMTQAISGLLTDADARSTAAKKAWDDSAKAYSSAAKLAKSAIGDANKRTTEASSALRESGGKDNRLQRVSSDGDMEASMHCLAAEIGVQIALLNNARIDAIRSDAATKSALAAALGTEKTSPAEDEIEKLRTEAVSQVAEAIKSYEKAAVLIGKTSAKFTDSTVTGKNYAWQVQVAQAAANLMQATLSADKPEESTAAREKAYKLLSDAARGREQSPLLAPTLDAIVHLQNTAR